MELLLETDLALRQMIPSVLDAAGLPHFATRLRSFEPILDHEVVVRACGLLQEIQEVSHQSENWSEIVSDAAFWAEGALWAASDGNMELLKDCMRILRKMLQVGYRVMLVH